MKAHILLKQCQHLILLMGIAAVCLTPVEAKNDKDKGNSNGNGNGNSAPDLAPDNGNGNNGNNGNSETLIGVGATKANPKKVHFKSGWNVNGDYEVVGPTILVIDGDFDIGNNTINISPTGSLEIYVSGNITVNGNGGINNQGVPANLLAFGTHRELAEGASPEYNWTLSGNGALTGVVYAPNAEYRTNGGGNAGFTSGSVVALDIRFNGSPGPFHYDVALSELILPFGGYSLSNYELLRNGSNGNLATAATIFGSSDYDALFKQLYP